MAAMRDRSQSRRLAEPSLEQSPIVGCALNARSWEKAMEHQQPSHGSAAPAGVGAKLRRWLRCAWLGFAALVILLVAAVAVYAAARLLPDRAVTYSNMPDHFKYG